MKGIFRPSNFIAKNKPLFKGVLSIALVVLPVLLLLLTPLPAEAQDLDCGGWFANFGCNLLAWLIRLGSMLLIILAAGIMFVLGIIVGFAKMVLDLAINMTLSVPYTSGPVIDAAWPVVRDIANMGLILVLIAIGVGTMLSLRSINKRLLVPFFIIAILINFTPLLTGMVIDLANITARIFYDSASAFSNALFNVGLWDSLTEKVGSAWSESGGYLENAESLGDVLGIILAVLMNAFLGMIFFLILILVYIILAVLFFVRMFFLWLLVILSPAAFLCYILPNTRKWFNRWMHNFLQWSIIVIPLLFFLWMAGLFANNADRVCTQFIEGGGGSSSYGFNFEGWTNQPELEYEVICQMTTTAMAVFAIAAGIVISTSSSAQGAKGIIKWTRKKYDEGMRRAGKMTSTGASWASRPAREKAKEASGQAGRWLMKDEGKGAWTGKLAQNKVFGAPVRGASKAMQTQTEKLRKQQAEADKKVAGKNTLEELKPHLLGGGSYNDRVAALKKAAQVDAKGLGDLMESNPHLKKRFAALQKVSDQRQDKELKGVEQHLPHLIAEKYDEQIEDVQKKQDNGSMSAKDANESKQKIQEDKTEALAKALKDATTATFGKMAVQGYNNKDVVDTIIKAGKINQAKNAVHGDKDRSDALNNTLGQHALPKPAAQYAPESQEQKRAREKYKRKARAEGADVTVTRDSKGRFKSKWEFTDAQIEEARKEMDAEFKTRAQGIKNYIAQNAPKSATDDTDRPWLAAASTSMGRAEKAGERVISRLNLERSDIEKLSSSIGDAVEQAMEDAKQKDPSIKDKELRKIFHDTYRQEFEANHHQHFGQTLYGSQLEDLMEYLKEEKIEEQKKENKWPDK